MEVEIGQGTKINDIEDVIHELAHMLAQGVSIKDLDNADSLKIVSATSRHGKVSQLVADHLELDANAITLLTGESLGLWPADRLTRAADVIAFFEGFDGDPKAAILSQMRDANVRRSATHLTRWLKN